MIFAPCHFCNNTKTHADKCPVEKYESEINYLRILMRKAIKDFHGKSVLFSSSFLSSAGSLPNVQSTERAGNVIDGEGDIGKGGDAKP